METVGPTPTPAPSIYAHKRIEFRPARRQYTGLGGKGGGDGGFRIETLNPDPGRKRAAAEAGLDNRGPGSKRGGEGPDFGDSLLDPELGFGVAVSRIRKIGAGLENLGNTCYLNSVLQCLTYTEPLAAYLQSGKHQSSCRIHGFCALCAIQKHVSRALESSGRSLVPKDLVSNLRCISRNFRNARQEDAHEYMVNLLESMHKCCLPSGVPLESPAAYEKSLVHKIFGGRLRSQVECQQCFYRSDKFDPFLDLSLEIFKADSVPLALRNFTASELLDGGEKHYQCQRCRDKVKAKKRLTVHKAPYVLTVHLKRFHALDPGRKVDRKVVFDNSLNLKPFYSGSYEGDLKYSLYGVLVHFGHNTHSGHYVCFIRTSSGIWYLLNDNVVRPVSEKTVLDQKAYMLFYVRDKKNVPLQKPSDIVKKENAKAIETMLFRQLTKDQRSSVSIETTTNAAVLSTRAKKLNANLSESFPQEASIQVNSIGSLSDGTKLNTDPGLKSSNGSMSKHLPDISMLKAESDLKPSRLSASNDQACPSSLSVDNNHHPSPPRASVSCKPGVATNSTASRATELHVISSSSNASPSLAAMPNQTSQMIDQVLPGMVVGKVPAKDTTNAATEDAKRVSDSKDSEGERVEAGLTQSPKELGLAIDQGGGSYSGSANTNSLTRNAHGPETLDKSVTLDTHKETVAVKDDRNPKQSTSVVLNGTLNAEASNGPPILSTNLRPATPLCGDSDCISKFPKEILNCEASDPKTCSKSRKKLTRCPIPGLRIGVGLFRSSLDIQKRKNRRKSKHNIVQVKAFVRESLVEDSRCFQLNQAQSKSGIKESLHVLPDISGEVLMEDNLKDAKVAADKKCQKGIIATSEDALQVTKRIDCTNDSKAIGMQTELVNMLTCGLKETKVARWDDVELPPISISDTNSSHVKSIGYIPDEWDEDYDRGKRKKIREFKREFGGPNPFQEIAIKKSRRQRDDDDDQGKRKKTRQFKKPRVQRKSRGQRDDDRDQGKRNRTGQYKKSRTGRKSRGQK